MTQSTNRNHGDKHGNRRGKLNDLTLLKDSNFKVVKNFENKTSKRSMTK